MKERGIALLTTPETIRTLQRKLYAKAKQEPGFRFYALYDKLWREDILMFAYRLVRANKGSPGIDGVSFEAIESGEGVEAFTLKLAQSLKERSYQTSAVRRVMIPKSDGSERPLGIPTIRDRVAQMAMKLVIEPIFEADFCPTSYGFRPKKSAHDAVDAIAESLHQGYTEVIDADLSKYFDSIPHRKLLAVVAERIVDGGILHLIKQWLKAAVIEEDKDGTRRNVGGGKANSIGTPQGGVISPLLSNCYLHLLDRIWQRHELDKKLGAKIVRYADDFVVLCKRGVDAPLHAVRSILDRLELKLNEDKTHIKNANTERFTFLGFEIGQRTSWKSGRRYTHIAPSAKSIAKIKARTTELTQRRRTLIPLPDVVRSVNASLRGWCSYFHYRNCSLAMLKVKTHAEERLRTHLMRRHKVHDRRIGFGRFPGDQLYVRYGLYKVSTKAGWTSAHASV